MRRGVINHFMLISCIALLIMGCTHKEVKEHGKRSEVTFNENWLYQKEGSATWDTVLLPHTTHIEPLVVNNQWQGEAWYRKQFTLEKESGRRYFIRFEGVMQEADVWINKQLLLHHDGGYLPFIVDFTNAAVNGENIIKVKVSNIDNPQVPPGKSLETLDFNMYGGIYRNVSLISTSAVYVTDPVEIAQTKGGGVMIHFDSITQEHASGKVSVLVRNTTEEAQDVYAKVTLTDASGGHAEFDTKKEQVAQGASIRLNGAVEVDKPMLWSQVHPNLYELKVEVYAGDQKVDEVVQKTGIRKIEITDEGFLLNGQAVYLRGTNRHQEYPYVGYAITDNADRRDAVKIKNAGFDIVRLSHYPQSEAFLEACDELGILVMDAIPGWQWFKEDSVFMANAYQNVRDMVRRDRNHPCVAFWEVSLNESGMSEAFMQKANAVLKEELPYEDTYSAGWIDNPAYDVFIPARQHGQAPDYWNFYKEGKRKIFIAEYGDWEYYAQNAGFSQKAFKDLKEEERTSRQLRGDGEKRLLQQALNFQEGANSNRKGIGTIGHANWLMFDYNRGYTNDLEASGISDIFRIPKFAYYFYRSQRDASENIQSPLVADGPMVKIANFWTPESPTTVRVYSNCDKVALYLNDSLIAIQAPTINQFSDHLTHPPFLFHLEKFEKVELKAVGMMQEEEVVNDIVRTPEEAHAIQLKLDLDGVPVSQKGKDIILVHAHIVDANGTTVPTASNEVVFEVSGEGSALIGENPVKAEAGIASILLKTTNGVMPSISASSKGMDSVHLQK